MLVVMVEGGKMHQPKASALSNRDCYYIAQERQIILAL